MDPEGGGPNQTRIFTYFDSLNHSILNSTIIYSYKFGCSNTLSTFIQMFVCLCIAHIYIGKQSVLIG